LTDGDPVDRPAAFDALHARFKIIALFSGFFTGLPNAMTCFVFAMGQYRESSELERSEQQQRGANCLLSAAGTVHNGSPFVENLRKDLQQIPYSIRAR
jgi:hypothetical protein